MTDQLKNTPAVVPNAAVFIPSVADPAIVQRVSEMTAAMFGQAPTVETLCDPNEPNDPMLVFEVTVHPRLAEDIEPRLQWHQRVQEITQVPFSRFCLSLAFDER